MKSLPAVVSVFAMLCTPGVSAADWKKELAGPLVRISGTTMVYEEFELCTIAPTQEGTEASSIQVRTRSEAPKDTFISRDNFVVITAAVSMAAVEQLGEPECKTLDTPIGQPDLEINIRMTESGMQVEYNDTTSGQKSRSTTLWQDLFAE